MINSEKIVGNIKKALCAMPEEERKVYLEGLGFTTNKAIVQKCTKQVKLKVGRPAAAKLHGAQVQVGGALVAHRTVEPLKGAAVRSSAHTKVGRFRQSTRIGTTVPK